MAGLPALMLLHLETKDKYVDLLRPFNNMCFWQQKSGSAYFNNKGDNN